MLFVANQRRRSVAVAMLLAAAPLLAARAQDDGSGAKASPFLAPDHWAVGAARRLAAAGKAPRSFGWGDGSLTQDAVGRVLYAAANGSTDGRDPGATAIAEGMWERFARELPAAAARIAPHERGRGAPRPDAAITLGVASETGRLAPVRSLDRSRENVSPPERRRDLDEARGRVEGSASLESWLAGAASAGYADGRWRLDAGHVLAAWRGVAVWSGRRSPDFGTGDGGGLVFDGRATFGGGGVGLLDAASLPGPLRHLGRVRGEFFLSRIDSSANVERPWVFGSHLSLTPHPRLLLGVTQGFMFSGDSLPPFTWRNFREMFLTHAIRVAGSEFENGIASAEVRFRPPLGRLPLVVYVEWGADDNHAAWVKFPAVVTGALLPALPLVPALSLGLERTSFAGPCRSCDGCACEYYATWYRHYVFRDGWTLDRQPIGHPLAGEGTEWLLYGTWDDPARRLRLAGHLFARDRGPYNLYAPSRQGSSVGSRISAAYRLGPRMEVRAEGAVEGGRRSGGWTTAAVRAGWRLGF